MNQESSGSSTARSSTERGIAIAYSAAADPASSRARAGHAVGLDVVGVPVEPVGVVGHDRVGLDLVDDLGERGRRLVDVRLPEAARVVVVRQAHHPRVAVPALAAEEPVVGDAERRARAVKLGDPVLAELVGQQVAQVGRDDLAHLAERAGDQRDPRALGGVPGHGGAGEDRLVVRVRVHEQQAAFHPASVLKASHPQDDR